MERSPFDSYEFHLVTAKDVLSIGKRLGKSALKFFTPLPCKTFASHGNHYTSHVANRGAEAFLAMTMDQEGEALESGQLTLFED